MTLPNPAARHRPKVPDLLTPIAWIAVLSALASAALIAGDILVLGHRQPMGIMEIVWPVTALYFGPFALPAYARWGRPRGGGERSMPAAVALAVSHCGAGCTIGDIVGSIAVLVFGLALAGVSVWAELPLDFVLAFALGIAFQYLTIAPMRHLGARDGVIAALKADTLSLTAFEVGLFGWMLLVQLAFFPVEHLHADHVEFWFLMQVGMVLGFVTAYPVNWWLVARGLKERM
jgi:hypothetical protein